MVALTVAGLFERRKGRSRCTPYVRFGGGASEAGRDSGRGRCCGDDPRLGEVVVGRLQASRKG